MTISKSEMLNLIGRTTSILGDNWLARREGSAIIVDPGMETQRIDRSASIGEDILLCAAQDGTIEDVTDQLDPLCLDGKGSRYYRFEIPRNIGYGFQGATTWENVPANLLASIKVLHAQHQDNEGNRISLVCDGLKAKGVHHGHVIVGEHQGEQVIFTWYPGDVTPFVDTRDVEVFWYSNTVPNAGHSAGDIAEWEEGEPRTLGGMSMQELERVNLAQDAVDSQKLHKLTVKCTG